MFKYKDFSKKTQLHVTTSFYSYSDACNELKLGVE